MKRTPSQRRRDRLNGLDRFGKPLPRVKGTNPRSSWSNKRIIAAQAALRGEGANPAST